MLLALGLAAFVATGAAVQSAQSTTPPARDAPAPPATGTASITGKVVAADGGRPIRRVQITLTSSELRDSRTRTTNSQGAFEFTDLPAGRYTLRASRGGYIQLQYGQRHPGEAGRAVPVADGQRLTEINFALPRTSAIVGRVTDELGDPLAGANIMPMQWRYFRGQRRLAPASHTSSPFNRTDDSGAFRISGLEPGDYIVMIRSSESWNDEKNPKESMGFLPTYAPGTGNPIEATRIKVGLGQEIVVPDVPLVPGRVGSISGTVTSATGASVAGQSVQLSQEFTGPGASTSFGAGSTRISADGSFTIRNVVPGEYRLSVRVPADNERAAEAVTMMVSMTGEDLNGLALTTVRGGTVRGRVATDTNQPLPPEQKMRVTASPVDRAMLPSNPDAGRVHENMTFEIPGVIGLNRFGISPLPTGWVLRSIDYNGKDIADETIDATAGLNNVVVMLTRRLPQVTGTLSDESGQPADGTVLMFPEDPAKWAETPSRLMRTARPDTAGGFTFTQVVPGTYLLAPVGYVRDGDWVDPEFLQTLRRSATLIRVDEGAASVPAVRLTLGK